MKEYRTLLLWKITEIGIGLLVAYLDWDPTRSFVTAIPTGLLPVVIMELIQMNLLMHRMEDLPGVVTGLAEGLSPHAAASELILMAITFSARKDLPHDDVWQELSKLLRRNYKATNYILFQNIYGNGKGDLMIKLQNAKHQAGEVAFSKVFLVADETEQRSDAFKQEVERQRPAGGMELRWMIRSKLTIDSSLKKEVENVGGLERTDFAIFDDSVVLIWKLNIQREVAGWDLVIGAENCRNFVRLFESIRLSATPC